MVHNIVKVNVVHTKTLVRIIQTSTGSCIELIVIYKVEGLLLSDAVDVGDLVPELHSVELVGMLQQLRSEKQNIFKIIAGEKEEEVLPEGCGDKLSAVGQLVDHVGHGLPVHGVERLVDLVKQVEWSRVAFLVGSYQ